MGGLYLVMMLQYELWNNNLVRICRTWQVEGPTLYLESWYCSTKPGLIEVMLNDLGLGKRR